MKAWAYFFLWCTLRVLAADPGSTSNTFSEVDVGTPPARPTTPLLPTDTESTLEDGIPGLAAIVENFTEGATESILELVSPTTGAAPSSSTTTPQAADPPPSSPPPTAAPPTTSPPPEKPSPAALTETLPSAPVLPDTANPPLPPPAEAPSDLPNAPEFLSFNEWREKYAMADTPAARRSRRAGQRARQDAAGGGAVGGQFDGDGADLGSLFENEEGAGVEEKVGEGGRAEAGPLAAQPVRKVEEEVARAGQAEGAAARGKDAGSAEYGLTSVGASPIQPLPNVGTGDASDPLLLLQDRSNYALFECAAMVHRSSRQSKGASSILVEKKDRYMLTPCAADPKFVELELCDEIRIDTIVLGNFEFFSSMFKHFLIKVSVNYPGRADEWHDLGAFRARNIRGVQVFHPKPTLGFYRYMRIDFLSHYGSEYYCPVSLLRVYGVTQMDAYRRDEERRLALEALAALAVDEPEDDEDELDVDIDFDTPFSGKGKEPAWIDEGESAEKNVSEEVKPVEERPVVEVVATQMPPASASSEGVANLASQSPAASSVDLPLSTTTSFPSFPAETIATEDATTDPATATPVPLTPSDPGVDESTWSSTAPPASSTDESLQVNHPTSTSQTATSATLTSSAAPSTSDENDQTLPKSSNDSPSVSSPSAASSPSPSASPSPSDPTSSSNTPPSSLPASASFPSPAPSPSPSTRPPTPESSITPARHIPRNETRHPLPPPPVQPQPGESIYGTIMKRLTSLEHNQTLSMHYIEAQSAMLRDAFWGVERRLGESEENRNKQEQLIRQALFDLEQHRQTLDRERLALTSQVNMLSQEILLEKRLGVAQLIGLLALFVFVGVTRGSPNTPFLHFVPAQALRQRNAKKEANTHENLRSEEGRSEEVRREELRREDVRRMDRAERSESSGDAYRKPRIVSTSLARVPSTSAKRYVTGTPKTAPRRHYAAPLPSKSRFGRPWTPPPRSSGSLPPDDVFSSTALPSSNLAPRRPSPLDHDRPALLRTQTSLSPNTSRPIHRPFLRRRPSADDADTEPSETGEEPFETRDARSRAGEEEGYRTISGSEDEAPMRVLRVLPREIPPFRPFVNGPSPRLGRGVEVKEESVVVKESPVKLLEPRKVLPEAPPEPEERKRGTTALV